MFLSMYEFNLSEHTSPFFTNPFVELFPKASSSTDLSDTTLSSLDTFNVSHTDECTIIDLEASNSSTDPKSSQSSPLPQNNRPIRVRQPLTYLRDYHYYSTIVFSHESSSYTKASVNPLWQQAM